MPLVEKVLDMLSANRKVKKRKKEPPVKPAEERVKDPSECPHHFGYLANRPKDVPIPEECLICPKTVDCMLKPGASAHG